MKSVALHCWFFIATTILAPPNFGKMARLPLSSRYLCLTRIQIELTLQGSARQVAPAEWLNKLFASRQLDEESASEYLQQSSFYKKQKWDLPPEPNSNDSEGNSDGYTSYDLSDYSPRTESVQMSDEDDEEESSSVGEGDTKEDENHESEDENEGPDSENEDEEEDDEEGFVCEPCIYEAFPPEYDPNWTDPWEAANDRLHQRFMDIFNDILLYFRLNSSRKALATDAINDEEDDVCYRLDYRSPTQFPRFSTRPDLIVLGQDERLLPRALDSYHRGMSTRKKDRADLYRGSVAVGKVGKVDGEGEGGKSQMLEKLATAAEYAYIQPHVHF